MDSALGGSWWIPPTAAVVAGLAAWLVMRWLR